MDHRRRRLRPEDRDVEVLTDDHKLDVFEDRRESGSDLGLDPLQRHRAGVFEDHHIAELALDDALQEWVEDLALVSHLLRLSALDQ